MCIPGPLPGLLEDIGKVKSPSKVRANSEFHLFPLRTVSYNMAGHPSWGLAWTPEAGWLGPVVPSLVFSCGVGLELLLLLHVRKLFLIVGIAVSWR